MAVHISNPSLEPRPQQMPGSARLQTVPSPQDGAVRAVFFDFMGTCLDWHSSIRSQLALDCREAFVVAIRSRPEGEPPENIDVTNARVLREVLGRPGNADLAAHFDAEHDANGGRAVDDYVRAWHSMDAWPDVGPELERIRSACPRCDILVIANGTTRLQLDLARSSGLRFDMLLSSELLGVAKPTKEAYLKAAALVGVDDQDDLGRCVMVAAHAYDTRAARAVGMRTVYVQRWTDDLGERDRGRLEGENNVFLDRFEGLAEAIAGLD